MKRSSVRSAITLTALWLSIALFSVPAFNAAPQHGFGVKEYDRFHEVLHPLQHEALPKNDFRRIRAKSTLLVNRGWAIVRLGIPAGTAADKREEFAEGLKKFGRALTRFKSRAKRGSNDQLKESYSAVHDSFEVLAEMLPRK